MERPLATPADAQADDLRRELVWRLKTEGADDLWPKLESCGELLELTCQCCGDRRPVETRCKQKWCPVCARRIAADRRTKFSHVVSTFTWPIFLTLTMKNTADDNPEGVRHLRQAFGRFRARAFWKRRVRGGIASIEVTNIGNGWHPHLHAVIDCRWLAIKTAAPQPNDPRGKIEALMRNSQRELVEAWARSLRHPTGGVHLKRADPNKILNEVTKYSLKASDLPSCDAELAPLIRVIKRTRLVTTFGSAFGIGKIPAAPPRPCERCGVPGEMIPTFLVDGLMASTRETRPPVPRAEYC